MGHGHLEFSIELLQDLTKDELLELVNVGFEYDMLQKP